MVLCDALVSKWVPLESERSKDNAFKQNSEHRSNASYEYCYCEF